jgi:hypothetical protein
MRPILAGLACLVALSVGTGVAHAQTVEFGDDSSDFARDGECDDRRFFGATMAPGGLDADNVGRDATDCKRGYQSGALRVWDAARARAATNCAAIDFGNDSSDWAQDGECDDFRFEGPGTAWVMLPEDNFRDATDCRRLCGLGQIALRDYE